MFYYLWIRNNKAEKWAPYVQSIVIFGRCHIIKEPSLIENMIKVFAMKYYPNEDLVNEEIKKSSKVVQMYEIEIEHLSGKEIQER